MRPRAGEKRARNARFSSWGLASSSTARVDQTIVPSLLGTRFNPRLLAPGVQHPPLAFGDNPGQWNLDPFIYSLSCCVFRDCDLFLVIRHKSGYLAPGWGPGGARIPFCVVAQVSNRLDILND